MRMRFALWVFAAWGFLLLFTSPAFAWVPETETEHASKPRTTSLAGADLWISKYSGTLDTTPGRTVKYYIPFGNRGPDIATAVVISDTLPSINGRYILTWEWDNAYALGLSRQHAAGEQRALQWRGELPPGASKTLEVVLRVAADISSCLTLPNVVSIGSSAPDPNREDNQAITYGPPIRLPDLSINKTVEGTAVPGETITYTLVYSNVGCVAAQDVLVIDRLPAQVIFVSASVPPDALEDNTVIWRDAILDSGPGQSVTISLVARVKDEILTGTMLTNTASITTASVENSPANNVSSITTTVKRADMALIKACPPTALPGQEIDYVLNYINLGSAMAKAVRIADELPPGSAFVTSTWQAGPETLARPLTPNLHGQTLTWGLGDVSVGISGTLTITVKLADWLQEGDVLTNSARIDTSTAEDGRDNNEASCATTIQRADLWLQTTCPLPTIPGRPITYVVEFGNRGSTTAIGVVVTDCLPSSSVISFSLVTCTVPYTPVTTSGDCHSWALADLVPGASGRMVFTATIAETAGEGKIEITANNVVSITTLTPELSYLNNNLTCSTPVRRSDIALAKWVTPNTTLTPGQALTFTLAYSNDGKAIAENVIVTDVLPAQFTYDATRTRPAPTRVETSAEVYTFTWEIGQVAAGTNGLITLGAGVSTTTSWHALIHLLTNEAYISTSTPESNLENQSASAEVRIAPGCPARLAVSAVPGRLPADGESETTLTITATDVYSNQVLNGTVLQLRTNHGQFKPEDSLPGGQSILRATQNGSLRVKLIAAPRASVAKVEISVLQPGEGCDPDKMGEVKTTQVITFEAAALQIDKAIQPTGPVTPGEPVTYTIIYSNKGPGVAMATSITDTLPEGFVVNWPITTTPEIALTHVSEQLLIWSAGDLSAGFSGTITITGYFSPTPNIPWQPAQVMSNCVSIASHTDDLAPEDNATCISKDLLTSDVWLEKRALQSEVRPRGTVAWRIRVGNKGPAIARQVLVTDTLPMGTTFFQSSITSTTVLTKSNQVVFAIGDLTPTQQLTLTLLALASPDDVIPAQVLTNHVQVSTRTYEWNTDNNAGRDLGVTVHAPDLTVRLAPAFGPLCEGRTFAYVVSYANLGNAPAEGVVITITFDAALGCAEGEECPQEVSFEVGTVDQGGSGQIPIRRRLPQLIGCYPGLPGEIGKILSSTACISTKTEEPLGARSNNCFTHQLLVPCCQFFVEVNHKRYGS